MDEITATISPEEFKLVQKIISSNPEKFNEIDSIEFMNDLDEVIVTINSAGINLNKIEVLLGWSLIESLYYARKQNDNSK